MIAYIAQRMETWIELEFFSGNFLYFFLQYPVNS